MHIIYDPVSGEIDGWVTGAIADVAVPDGMSVIAVDLDDAPDPKTEKIDTVTLLLVAKNATEQVAANVVTEREVQVAIFVALSSSDSKMLPDRDDISPQDRNKWVMYRKTLRDLSKGDPRPTPAAMIAAWPLDPDGIDAIANLRNRNQ